MQFYRVIVTAVLYVCLFTLPSRAQYKDFIRKETKSKLLQVSFDKNNVAVTKYSAGDSITVMVSRENIQTSAAEIRMANDVIFTAAGLLFQGEILPYQNISDADVFSDNDQTRITFYESTLSPAQIKKMREGNVISFADSIIINKGDFVRGLVLSIRGPITVGGEVNKDIISLFGDVTVTTGAAARGDIASITGRISVEPHASLYGEIYSGTKDYDSRRYRYYRENEFEPDLMMNYNRVDGLLFGGKCSYVDADSILPSAEIEVGFAFESERWRYRASLSHTIIRRHSVKVGAAYFQKLASGDDWILGNAENAVFVILANEDFKDYYETESFSGWIEIKPARHLELKTGYRYDDTHWLRARRQMWSLFGGSKIFRENFGSVSEPYRSIGVSEIESNSNGSIFIESEYDDREFDSDFNTSGFALSGEMEWSHPNFGSDFNYRRYSLTAVRYQYVSKHTGLKWRGSFANSDGYLPMYKRFFIGGLGTLQGFKHKEFMGTRYWMANTEFWVNLPFSLQTNLIFVWDVAQIANDAKLGDSSEIRHDVGLGLRMAGIRLDLGKRLDSAFERSLKVYVRFSRDF